MFRWVDHTAELQLEIEAPTEEAVFAEALAALAELLSSAREPDLLTPASDERGRNAHDEPSVHRRIRAAADDRPALLAAWMEELLFLAEDEGFEPVAVESLELGARWLEAMVAGRLGHPPPLVKAVTYHLLSFAAEDDGYRATAVLDV
jgi:SHS2 domain-containing protein